MVADTLEVLAYPDPTLRQVCEDCDPADKSLRNLTRRMAKTMYADNGCGLAAPQVGVLKRLIVIDCDQDSGAKNPITLLNPTVIETRGPEVVEEEGCLSVPGITVPIRRPAYAIVRYTDLNGEDWIIEGDGLLARCLQHEVGHLDGFLYTDVLTGRWKRMAKKTIKANSWTEPGRTWMPGVDPDPFGHDDVPDGPHAEN